MTEGILAIILTYAAVTVFVLWGSLLIVCAGSRREGRYAARVAILCWAWPVLLVGGVWRGIRHLWDLADWGRR